MIIYLACGAPFGVYRASSGDSTWMRVVLSVLIWPVFAIRLATSKGRQRATNIQDLLLSTRKSIETAAFVASSPEAVFDFREIFDRYTGLALAAQESAAPAVAGLFELTGHPSRPLAESCMVRSQKARLGRHVNAARAEFASTLGPGRSDELNCVVQILADLLDDPALVLTFGTAEVATNSGRRAARVG